MGGRCLVIDLALRSHLASPRLPGGHLRSHRLTADYVGNDLNIGGSFSIDRISCMQTENMDTLVCEIE